MKTLATASLASISLCALLALSGCGAERKAAAASAAPLPCAFRTDATVRYRVSISAPKATFTGIGVLRFADGAWRGSLLNEFGVKAFDFEATPGQCTLLHVMPMLDRRLVRRTIERDLACLLWYPAVPAGKRALACSPSGGITLRNTKRNIHYVFEPLQP